MERLPLHQTLMDKITTDSGARPWKGNNGQRHNGQDTNDVELFELLCPSDTNGSRTSAGMTTRGRTSYRVTRRHASGIMDKRVFKPLEGREPQDGLVGTTHTQSRYPIQRHH